MLPLRRLACLLALFAAGCGTVPGRDAIIVTPGNFKAGSGVIQSVGVLRNANPSPAPAPKGRAPNPNLYRLFIQMDIGGFQTVDVDSDVFMAGQVVDLTNDGRVVRISGTEFTKGRDKEQR